MTPLGDPVMKIALPDYPDFEMKSNDISLVEESIPHYRDALPVKLKISNWDLILPG